MLCLVLDTSCPVRPLIMRLRDVHMRWCQCSNFFGSLRHKCKFYCFFFNLSVHLSWQPVCSLVLATYMQDLFIWLTLKLAFIYYCGSQKSKTKINLSLFWVGIHFRNYQSAFR